MFATLFSHGSAESSQLQEPTADQLADALAAGLSVFLARPVGGVWPTMTLLHHPGHGFQIKFDRTGTGEFLSLSDAAADATPVAVTCCGPTPVMIPGNTLVPLPHAVAALRHFHATGEPAPEFAWTA